MIKNCKKCGVEFDCRSRTMYCSLHRPVYVKKTERQYVLRPKEDISTVEKYFMNLNINICSYPFADFDEEQIAELMGKGNYAENIAKLSWWVENLRAAAIVTIKQADLLENRYLKNVDLGIL